MASKTIYHQLAETVGAGDSKYVPRIFEVLTNEDEAKILLTAAPPATVAELSEKCGLAASHIEQLLERLFAKGLILKSKKPDATRYYRVRNLLQMHDATAVALDASREMLDLWKGLMADEYERYNQELEKVLPSAVMRVIPVNVSISAQSQILAFDDIQKIVDSARTLAVTKCSCRVIDGSCGKPVEVCVQVDKAADYAIERGTGRPIEKTAALELMKQCEKDGLIHVSDNKRAPGHVICNCCSDCCIAWPSVRTGLGKFIAPSRFCAQVDADHCSSCETCLDRCFFEAIDMSGPDDTAEIAADKCMGCGVCLVTCPEDAISLKAVRPEAFIPG